MAMNDPRDDAGRQQPREGRSNDDQRDAAGKRVVPMKREDAEEAAFLSYLRSLSDDMMTAPVPPSHEMIVEDILPHRAVSLLAAEGGSGKSVQVRSLATSFAYWRPGATWLGYPISRPKGSGRVLIVTGETTDEMETGDFRGLYSAESQAAYCHAHGIEGSPNRIKVAHARMLGGKLFCLRDGEICLTKGGRALVQLIHEWQPELVILDTLASLVMGMDIDGNTTQAQGLMTLLGNIAQTGAGCAVIVCHHFSKLEDTPSLRAARMQTKGSAGFTDGGRNTLNLYLAYPPLEQIVRRQVEWITDDCRIVAFGSSKNNIRGMPEGRPRVYVQRPLLPGVDSVHGGEAVFFQPLVDVTEEVLAHPYGTEALFGRIVLRKKSLSMDDLDKIANGGSAESDTEDADGSTPSDAPKRGRKPAKRGRKPGTTKAVIAARALAAVTETTATTGDDA